MLLKETHAVLLQKLCNFVRCSTKRTRCMLSGRLLTENERYEMYKKCVISQQIRRCASVKKSVHTKSLFACL